MVAQSTSIWKGATCPLRLNSLISSVLNFFTPFQSPIPITRTTPRHLVFTWTCCSSEIWISTSHSNHNLPVSSGLPWPPLSRKGRASDALISMCQEYCWRHSLNLAGWSHYVSVTGHHRHPAFPLTARDGSKEADMTCRAICIPLIFSLFQTSIAEDVSLYPFFSLLIMTFSYGCFLGSLKRVYVSVCCLPWLFPVQALIIGTLDRDADLSLGWGEEIRDFLNQMACA